MLSMQSMVTYQQDSQTGDQSGWSLPLKEIIRRGPQSEFLPDWLHAKTGRRLPFMPRWPGFAANAAVYFAALLVCRYFWLQLPLHFERTSSGDHPSELPHLTAATNRSENRLAVAVFLTLLLSSVALWIRSYQKGDSLDLTKS
jgi:hypothetical protein